MCQPRARGLLANPLSSRLELSGSPPEEGDPVLLIGRCVGGTYLRRGWRPLREAGAPKQPRQKDEPQKDPLQEPGPHPHSLPAIELAQKDVISLDQVVGHLRGRPFPLSPGAMPGIRLDLLGSGGERGRRRAMNGKGSGPAVGECH